MEYFTYKVDTDGYIHSIDNLVIAYDFQSTSYNTIKKFIPKIQNLSKMFECNYYEKLDLNACRKYSFCKDFIHLDDGIVLFFGNQVEKFKDADNRQEKFLTLPLVKLEVNPNKHHNKPILKEILRLLSTEVYDARILRLDYAIDIQRPLNDIQVFSTNKEKGLYKGTRYFGQRNKNGFTRIYDKGKEQNLDETLSRVETVISYVKGTKNISFEKVYIKDDKKDNAQKLSKTDSAIIELCQLCIANGIDYNNALDMLDFRKRKTISENIGNGNYKLLKFNQDILNQLIQECMVFFDVTTFPEVKDEEPGDILLDGFTDCDDLPFD